MDDLCSLTTVSNGGWSSRKGNLHSRREKRDDKKGIGDLQKSLRKNWGTQSREGEWGENGSRKNYRKSVEINGSMSKEGEAGKRLLPW